MYRIFEGRVSLYRMKQQFQFRQVLMLAALLGLTFFGVSCGGENEKAQSSELAKTAGAEAPDSETSQRIQVVQGLQDVQDFQVMVGIPPLQSLTKALGVSPENTGVIIPAGKDPHMFDPSPAQLARISQADLVVITGMPFENMLAKKMNLSSPKLCDLSKGVTFRGIEAHHHGHEAHDHHSSESPENQMGMDPHIWLGPKALKVMAANLALCLENSVKNTKGQMAGTKTAESGSVLRDGLNSQLQKWNQALDSALSEVDSLLQPHQGKKVFVYHPSFGYLLDHWGLVQTAVESEGKEPGPAALHELAENMKSAGAKVIFVQPQFSRLTAQSLTKSTGSKLMVIDPLATDLPQNLVSIGKKIAYAFSDSSKTGQ